MDSFLKQLRVRFSGEEKDNQEGRRRIPSQKSQSFKDQRRSTSWLDKQFSRKMSRDYDSRYGSIEYAAAVAAAAYAIISLEDSSGDHRGLGPEKNVPIRSATIIDAGKPIKPTSSSIKKTPTFKNSTNGEVGNKPEVEAPEKIERPASSFRKTSTFGDKLLDRPASRKSDSPVNTPAPRRSKSQPTTPRGPSPTKSVLGGTKADVWEREEMEKIKKRYEKLDSTILEWETKKKKKAKRQLQGIEAELDARRAKALEHYRNEVERIVTISGGARTQAEQNRQNEEFKVKEKASKYRYTGKAPATCWCF